MLRRRSYLVSGVLHVSLLGTLTVLPLAALRSSLRPRPMAEVRLARLTLEQTFDEVSEPVHEMPTVDVAEELPEVVPRPVPPEPERFVPLPGPRPNLAETPLDRLPLDTRWTALEAEPDSVEASAPNEPLPLAPIPQVEQSARVEPAVSQESLELTEPLEPSGPAPTQPVLLRASCPEPEYPKRALLRGLEGSVLCRLTVEADGSVSRVVVETTSGFAVLDRAAVRALEGWRLSPGTRAGAPARMEFVHRVTFRLSS